MPRLHPVLISERVFDVMTQFVVKCRLISRHTLELGYQQSNKPNGNNEAEEPGGASYLSAWTQCLFTNLTQYNLLTLYSTIIKTFPHITIKNLSVHTNWSAIEEHHNNVNSKKWTTISAIALPRVHRN